MKSNKRKCYVPSCTTRIRAAAEAKGPISFHIFPTRPLHKKVREQWIQCIRTLRNEPDWNPTPMASICSRHFEEGCTFGSTGRFRKVSFITRNLGEEEVDEIPEEIQLPPPLPPSTSEIRECCSLCGTKSDVRIVRGLPNDEQEQLKGMIVKENGGFMVPVMSILCPPCGEEVSALLSLEKEVRRMDEKLRSKIQAFMNMVIKEDKDSKELVESGFHGENGNIMIMNEEMKEEEEEELALPVQPMDREEDPLSMNVRNISDILDDDDSHFRPNNEKVNKMIVEDFKVDPEEISNYSGSDEGEEERIAHTIYNSIEKKKNEGTKTSDPEYEVRKFSGDDCLNSTGDRWPWKVRRRRRRSASNVQSDSGGKNCA